MKPKIFIDGGGGTAGLKLSDRLKNRRDLEILRINRKKRKDPGEKEKIYGQADIVFLCLPDDAARKAARLIDTRKTRIIDTSTAHRCAEGWVYGLPELLKKNSRSEKYRQLIKISRRVSVPGCYATGFALCVNPLSGSGLISRDLPIICMAITGRSGGGRKMIAEYESYGPERMEEICCRIKNLDLNHKHLPEMEKYSLLKNKPLFFPVVGNFFQGMLVTIPLIDYGCHFFKPEIIRDELKNTYQGENFVRVVGAEETEKISAGFLSPTALNDTNRAEIFVFGESGSILLVARLDNLGKGSSGAAVQCMNLMLGIPETTGLI
jgi:N-acetyl-gamma-glutamyl-phosphate reductase